MSRYARADPTSKRWRGFHERARSGSPGRAYDVARVIARPWVRLLYGPRCIGAEKVPAPAIVAANHFSNLDPFVVALCLPARVRFMGKAELFESRLAGVLPRLGAFPVLRGQGDEETFDTAHAVLEQGDVLVMFPEGSRSAPGELRDPKPGVGRLALESGVPVVPTAISGSEEVRRWKRLRFPSITVRYGEPMSFDRVEQPTRDQAQEAAERVFDEVRRLHADVQREGR